MMIMMTESVYEGLMVVGWLVGWLVIRSMLEVGGVRGKPNDYNSIGGDACMGGGDGSNSSFNCNVR